MSEQASSGKRQARAAAVLFLGLLLAACTLLTLGCRPATPADTTARLRVGFEAGVVACRLYLAHPELPRDEKLDASCPALLDPSASCSNMKDGGK
jgi:hypothetical protein